ncbi:unnamed protein product [Amoebophrya sp. A25]|nr:unnamed protein product [Amoebophrya sp. A25]|eukprot:GSA25T00015886001.1
MNTPRTDGAEHTHKKHRKTSKERSMSVCIRFRPRLTPVPSPDWWTASGNSVFRDRLLDLALHGDQQQDTHEDCASETNAARLSRINNTWKNVNPRPSKRDWRQRVFDKGLGSSEDTTSQASEAAEERRQRRVFTRGALLEEEWRRHSADEEKSGANEVGAANYPLDKKTRRKIANRASSTDAPVTTTDSIGLMHLARTSWSRVFHHDVDGPSAASSSSLNTSSVREPTSSEWRRVEDEAANVLERAADADETLCRQLRTLHQETLTRVFESEEEKRRSLAASDNDASNMLERTAGGDGRDESSRREKRRNEAAEKAHGKRIAVIRDKFRDETTRMIRDWRRLRLQLGKTDVVRIQRMAARVPPSLRPTYVFDDDTSAAVIRGGSSGVILGGEQAARIVEESPMLNLQRFCRIWLKSFLHRGLSVTDVARHRGAGRWLLWHFPANEIFEKNDDELAQRSLSAEQREFARAYGFALSEDGAREVVWVPHRALHRWQETVAEAERHGKSTLAARLRRCGPEVLGWTLETEPDRPQHRGNDELEDVALLSVADRVLAVNGMTLRRGTPLRRVFRQVREVCPDSCYLFVSFRPALVLTDQDDETTFVEDDGADEMVREFEERAMMSGKHSSELQGLHHKNHGYVARSSDEALKKAAMEDIQKNAENRRRKFHGNVAQAEGEGEASPSTIMNIAGGADKLATTAAGKGTTKGKKSDGSSLLSAGENMSKEDPHSITHKLLSQLHADLVFLGTLQKKTIVHGKDKPQKFSEKDVLQMGRDQKRMLEAWQPEEKKWWDMQRVRMEELNRELLLSADGILAEEEVRAGGAERGGFSHTTTASSSSRSRAPIIRTLGRFEFDIPYAVLEERREVFVAAVRNEMAEFAACHRDHIELLLASSWRPLRPDERGDAGGAFSSLSALFSSEVSPEKEAAAASSKKSSNSKVEDDENDSPSTSTTGDKNNSKKIPIKAVPVLHVRGPPSALDCAAFQRHQFSVKKNRLFELTVCTFIPDPLAHVDVTGSAARVLASENVRLRDKLSDVTNHAYYLEIFQKLCGQYEKAIDALRLKDEVLPELRRLQPVLVRDANEGRERPSAILQKLFRQGVVAMPDWIDGVSDKGNADIRKNRTAFADLLPSGSAIVDDGKNKEENKAGFFQDLFGSGKSASGANALAEGEQAGGPSPRTLDQLELEAGADDEEAGEDAAEKKNSVAAKVKARQARRRNQLQENTAIKNSKLGSDECPDIGALLDDDDSKCFVLAVYLRGASNVPQADLFSPSDPYVQVRCIFRNASADGENSRKSRRSSSARRRNTDEDAGAQDDPVDHAEADEKSDAEEKSSATSSKGDSSSAVSKYLNQDAFQYVSPSVEVLDADDWRDLHFINRRAIGCTRVITDTEYPDWHQVVEIELRELDVRFDDIMIELVVIDGNGPLSVSDDPLGKVEFMLKDYCEGPAEILQYDDTGRGKSVGAVGRVLGGVLGGRRSAQDDPAGEEEIFSSDPSLLDPTLCYAQNPTLVHRRYRLHTMRVKPLLVVNSETGTVEPSTDYDLDRCRLQFCCMWSIQSARRRDLRRKVRNNLLAKNRGFMQQAWDWFRDTLITDDVAVLPEEEGDGTSTKGDAMKKSQKDQAKRTTTYDDDDEEAPQEGRTNAAKKGAIEDAYEST